MKLAKAAIKGGLWTAGVRYPSFILNFICNLILARLIVPEQFGVFALAFSLAEMIFFLNQLGLSQACVQLQDEKDIFDTGVIIAWGWALSLFAIALIGAFVLSHWYSNEILEMMVVICGIKMLELPCSIYMAKLDVDLKFKERALCDGLSKMLGVFLAVFLAWLGFGIWSLAFREILYTVLLFASVVWIANYRFHFDFHLQTAKKILKFSSNLLLIGLAQVVYVESPKLIMGTLSGVRMLAPFERGLYLSELPNRLLSQFYGHVAFSVYAKSQHEPHKIGVGLEWCMFFTCRLMWLAGLVIFLFPKFIFTLLLGNQWVYGAPFFQGFFLYLLFKPIFEAQKNALLAVNKGRLVFLATLTSMSVVLLGIFSVWYADLSWTLMSWIYGLGVFFASVLLGIFCEFMGIKIQWFKVFGFPIIMGAVCSIVHFMINSDLTPFIQVPVFIVVWGLVSLSLEWPHYRHFLSFLKN